MNEDEDASDFYIDFQNFKYHEKARDLYTYLMLRLNATVANLVQLVPEDNGFEVYRIISQEMDVISENTGFQLQREIRNMAGTFNKKMEATRAFIVELDKKAAEYFQKTAKRIDDKTMAFTLWESLDEDTMDYAEKKDFDRESLSYRQIKELVNTRFRKKLSRRAVQVGGGRRRKEEG